MSVRVRFAPSPTGYLHVGALRTALYDDLFARKNGGANILRIEDTDRSRYNPASEQEFVDSLKWVGIEFNEGPHVGGPFGPYRQSERKAAGLYEPIIAEVLAKGIGYKAFDTPEELEEMRLTQQLNKRPTGYFGGRWRDASPDEVAQAESEGKPYVIRLRVRKNQKIVIDDAIRGRIEWESNLVDDPVLIKADGMPTYHFAAITDDQLMKITHVFRGEEWVSSAPKHVEFIDQMGWDRPVFVHCPVIVGKGGKKLSKRDGSTRVLDYMSQGYAADPLKNFIALIGWSPGDNREELTPEELVQAFDIKGLQPSPGKFDIDKLNWLNGSWIRKETVGGLRKHLINYIEDPITQAYWSNYVWDPESGEPKTDGARTLATLNLLARFAHEDPAYCEAALQLEQERVQKLSEFGEACSFFFEDEPLMMRSAVDKWLVQPHVSEMLGDLAEEISQSNDPKSAQFESVLKEWQVKNGYEKLGPIVHPVRVALTGRTFGPGLWELMEVLGRDRVVNRLRAARTLSA